MVDRRAFVRLPSGLIVILRKVVDVGELRDGVAGVVVVGTWSRCYKTFYGRNYVAIGVTQSKS